MTSLDPTLSGMRLHRLSVRNYRGFEALDLDFERDVTVLVGVNGAGKTSLLEAVFVLINHWNGWLRGWISSGNPPVQTWDDERAIRNGADWASVEIWAEIAGMKARWRLVQAFPGGKAPFENEEENIRGIAKTIESTFEQDGSIFPLAVYFSSDRGFRDTPLESHAKKSTALVRKKFISISDLGQRDFKAFFEWYREEEDIFNEQIAFGEDVSRSPLLTVKRAISALFVGGADLRVERRHQRMTLVTKGGRLDVNQLSDGEKCLLAVAGDLARRMVLAAPGREDALSQPAVVLIDELELHLHPGVQRTILPRLRQVFPQTQFIVSTHSPQVLSSVQSRSVRLLEDFNVRPLERGTWRRDTNRILESVFGDSGRPPEVARKLSQLRDAVDEDRREEAYRFLDELKGMIEGDDPDLFFYEQLLPPREKPSGPEATPEVA